MNRPENDRRNVGRTLDSRHHLSIFRRKRRERIGNMIVRSIAGGVEVLAPAKLNLFLEVLGRRPDGYHEIETLMVTVNLYDTLVLRRPDRRDHSAMRRSGLAEGKRQPRRQGRFTTEASAGVGVAPGSCFPTSRSRQKLVLAAARAMQRRPWWRSTGSGTCGCLPDRLDALAAKIGSDVAFFPARTGGDLPWAGRGRRTAGSLQGALSLRAGLSPSRHEHGRRLSPTASARSARPIGLVSKCWHTVTRSTSVEACLIGFNRSQKPLRPDLVPGPRTAPANLDPPLAGFLMSGSGSGYFGLGRDSAVVHRAAESPQTARTRMGPRVVTCGP